MKFFLLPHQVAQRVDRAVAKHVVDLKKRITSSKRNARRYPLPADETLETRIHNWTVWERKALLKPFRSAFPLRYRKLSLDFVGANCDFDPKTGLGHSYGWWNMTQVIKGRLVLNTYRYSNSTSRHIYAVRTILKKLSLRYLEVEAPRGLQDLDRAARHAMEKSAEIVVANRYARKPVKSAEKYWANQLALIKKLGGKCALTARAAIAQAEKERAERLAFAKQKRIAKQQADADRDARITAAGGTGPNSHTGVQS